MDRNRNLTVHRLSRAGGWLPTDRRAIREYLRSLLHETKLKAEPLAPVVVDFKQLIETDPKLYMYFKAMFEEVPDDPDHDQDPTGQPEVRDYRVMLELINKILKKAPEYNDTGLVGFPINAILDWAMGTEAGFAAFLNDKVNAQFKKILTEWTKFLTSPASCYVLNKDDTTGWFGRAAQQKMPGFAETFICDPSQPYYGFKSWDDFFTRRFVEGARPLPPDDDSIIVNSCESAPLFIQEKIQKMDTFWLKEQRYSLAHMLADDNKAEQFVGGTIYQAFLSATNYHRWHSPVNGTVEDIKLIDGTYYSEAPDWGFDPSAPNDSQVYISHVAARGIIYIQCDNPEIGLMCIVFIGMAEVSSCEFTVQKGQKIKKGEEIGMFHFGGSTHCLVFGPKVKVVFDLDGQKPGLNAKTLHVNKQIGHLYA